MNFRSIRLSRDLRFLEKNPVDGAACEPVDGDDMREWHGNVLLGSGTDAAVYHFVLSFPPDYPSAAPVVRFATAVPHPNVLANGRFCTELLGNTQWAHDEVEGGKGGWSSAYSPFSVLLSLVCMKEELLDDHNGVGPGVAATRAREFRCAACGHGPSREWPLIDEAGRMRAVEVFVPPPVTLLVPKEPVPVKPVVASVVAAPPKPAPSNPTAPKVVPVTVVAPVAVVARVAKQVAPKKAKKDDGWVVVGVKKPAKQSKPEPKKTQAEPKKAQSQIKPAVLKSVQTVTEAEYVPVGWVDEKAEKKRRENQKRRLREKAKVQAQLEAARVAAEAKAQKVQEKKEAKKAALAKAAPVTTVAPVKAQKDPRSAEVVMGAFAKVPSDVIAYMLRFVSLGDVIRASLVCRGFAKVARNTFLWRDLYAREFPLSKPTHFGDFRHMYTLRVQGIVSELVCFHTKATLMESPDVVLGYGLNYTKNPKTNRLDYVDVASELMSAEAFYTLKVRRGPRGEEIRAFLPLYLTAEHFGRARVPDLLKRVATELCPEDQLEEGLIRLLCCALNTRAVLLADKGVGNADSSFAVYSQLQRLFMALAGELPYIQRIVEERVHSFVVAERNREKEAVASLGEFIPLLLVSRRYSWAQVRPLLVREVLARNVLWAGRHNTALANNESALSAAERCAEFWKGTVVSNRLMMLSALFLAMARREGGLAEQARVLDRLYGRQSLKTLATIKRAAAAMLGPEAGWPMYFKALVGQPLAEARVEGLLKDAVRDSRRKGYHSARTNFSAIMASGVSSVLRKGESYTTSSHVDEIVLSLGWHFPSNVIFLDASLLCFNASGAYIRGSQLDYNSPVNGVLGEAAMHSGDQITGKQGEHMIRISLHKIPKVVQTMYFVLSAWTNDLSAILNPFVKLVDTKCPDSDLCSFSLERAGSSQAVIMCSVTRSMSGWKVVPHGVTSRGTARSYEPMLETIQNMGRRAAMKEE